MAYAVAAGMLAASPALAQTSLSGSSLALRSTGSATLGSNGYVGTYLVVPSGGATVNFTITATASSGATAAPHMNLVVADTLAGFTVASTSATPYATPNVTLPAGTYFIRNERDYIGNVGVSRSFTVNNLSVNTVSGSTATFANSSTDTNARNAADTYIENFRKGAATVSITGPGSIPLLPGTPVQVDLGRHAFNFGNAVAGNSSSDVNSYLGSNGTTLQTNYQSRLNQNFNSIVPANAGKWQNNEFTRDVVTMNGVDQVLNYAQSHNMRARMHNLIWGKNSFNGQQPSWVLNNSNTGLLDQALAGNMTAAADLRAEISERIAYYLNSSRAPKIVEMDVYNESLHEPEYRTAFGYDSTDGIASIHNEAAAAAAAAGATTKMFVNEYNVFQDGSDSWANWYRNEIQSIRNAGGNVGGVGMQYYPNQTIGTANNQHSAARMMAVLNNMSVQGLPIALTEFGVKAGGEAIAPTVLDDSMRLTFGTPNSTGFMMWGFWAGEGLFAPGSAMYDNSWNITDTGKRWQDLLGIVDWDGNPNNAWDTNLTALADASGAISFNGFFGDYYLRGQTSGAFDLTLAKGTSSYTLAMSAPPTWSLWNPANSGNWSSGANWTTGGSANAAGQTAYFGNAAAPRNITVNAATTVGMIALDSAAGYTISGGSAITLRGFDNAAGHHAVVHVAQGSHTVSAPLVLADDTVVNVAATNSVLTLSNLQPTSVQLTKSGGGSLHVNRLPDSIGVEITAGRIKVLESSPNLPDHPSGSNASVSRLSSLGVAAGATLDLTNNDLILDYSGASPAADIETLVASGYNVTGDWQGDGITSSVAAADSSYVLAVADNAALAAPFGTEQGGPLFAGVDVDLTTVLIKFTHRADLNLDGLITPDDAAIFGTNYSENDPATRAAGDMDYDGIFTPTDAAIFGTFYDESVGSLPEPLSLSLLALLGASLGRRRAHA